MKLKYYLRGLGTGILFAAIILTISHAIGDKKTSESETTTTNISQEKNQDTTEENTAETTTQEITTTQESTTTQDISTAGINDEKVMVTVASGMSSEGVSSMLQEKGVISNSTEFDSYLKENGYSKIIAVGNYEIDSDLTFKEIAEIITKTN